MRSLLAVLVFAPSLAHAGLAPKELTDRADALRGPFTCSSADLQGTRTVTLDLDRWWIHTEEVDRIGKDVLETADYISYDATTKQWQRIRIDNLGGSEHTTSPGPTAHGLDMVWTGEQQRGGATLKVRHTERRLRADRDPDDAVRVKDYQVLDETSTDGKTWTKQRELACKTNRSANRSSVTDFMWTQTPRNGSSDVRLVMQVGGKPVAGEQDDDIPGRFELSLARDGHPSYGAHFDPNPNGRYVFNGMTPGTYEITIEDSQHVYKPVTRTGVRFDPSQAVTLTIDLTK